MRTLRPSALVRKVTGLVFAVAGITIVINTLPKYLWLLVVGFGLIWVGWIIFRQERIF
ncbi:MAG: hypothetical protein GX893_00875 [Firmicutes bacterium]|nr:hypothetical protein [Bacillota bacterium]